MKTDAGISFMHAAWCCSDAHTVFKQTSKQASTDGEEVPVLPKKMGALTPVFSYAETVFTHTGER